jgi:hypothetical protein
MGDWKFTDHCAEFSARRGITCNSLMFKDFLEFASKLGRKGFRHGVYNIEQSAVPVSLLF